MTMPAMFRTFLSHLCVLVLTMAVLTGCVTSPLSIAQRHNEGLSPGDTGYMTVRGDCENFKDDNGTDGLDTNDGDGDNYCRACMQANDIFVAPLPSDMVVATDFFGNHVGPVLYIVKIIQQRIQTVTNQVVTGITSSSEFNRLVLALMTLSVIMYSVFVLTGSASSHPIDMLTVLVKIIMVYGFATNYPLLKYYTQDFGEAIVGNLSGLFMQYMSGIDLSTTSSAVNGDPTLAPVEYIDRTLNMFFHIRFYDFLATLAFTGIVGLGYVVVLAFLLVLYVIAMLRVLLYFVMAMVARYFLYAVAPFFVLGLMFRQTRTFFDNWVQQLANFILQAVLLMVFVSIFHAMLFGIFGFMATSVGGGGGPLEMCWMYWVTIWGSRGWGLFRYRFSTDGGLNPIFTIVPTGGMMLDMYVVLTAVILCVIMFMFCSFVQAAAAHISGGIVTVSKTGVEAWGTQLARVTGKRAISGATGAVKGAAWGGIAGATKGLMTGLDQTKTAVRSGSGKGAAGGVAMTPLKAAGGALKGVARGAADGFKGSFFSEKNKEKQQEAIKGMFKIDDGMEGYKKQEAKTQYSRMQVDAPKADDKK